MSLVPRSLGGRLALLLVCAVVGAQAVTFALFARETTRVGRAAARTQVVEKVATLVRLLDALPPQAVPGAVAAFGSPRHHFAIGAESLVPDGAMDADETRLAHRLDRRVREGARNARVALVERDSVHPEEADAGARGGKLQSKPQILQVAVQLDDGRWLNGEAPLASTAPPWMRIGLFQLGASVVAVLIAVALALRGIVGPVTALSRAAEAAGRGAALPPLPERGPRELRLMTAAFNGMQARLRAFVTDRTRMLAAISHDLRTPIASLWLRAEMVDDAPLRAAMVRTLTQMRDMVEATLAFARDDAEGEDGAPLDLAALARAVTEDHVALGREVVLSAPLTLPFHGRATALRRALDNLIENAVRYGGRARVRLEARGGMAVIRIDDDGPGIPEARIEEMFAPFARLEGSRSEETGGTGLGLAIVRSAVRAHGGEVGLTNRTGGGLRAEIVLPLADAHR